MKKGLELIWLIWKELFCCKGEIYLREGIKLQFAPSNSLFSIATVVLLLLLLLLLLLVVVVLVILLLLLLLLLGHLKIQNFFYVTLSKRTLRVWMLLFLLSSLLLLLLLLLTVETAAVWWQTGRHTHRKKMKERKKRKTKKKKQTSVTLISPTRWIYKRPFLSISSSIPWVAWTDQPTDGLTDQWADWLMVWLILIVLN